MFRIIKKGMGILILALISLTLFSATMSGCSKDEDNKDGLGLLLLLGLSRTTPASGYTLTIPTGVAQ